MRGIVKSAPSCAGTGIASSSPIWTEAGTKKKMVIRILYGTTKMQYNDDDDDDVDDDEGGGG